MFGLKTRRIKLAQNMALSGADSKDLVIKLILRGERAPKKKKRNFSVKIFLACFFKNLPAALKILLNMVDLKKVDKSFEFFF